MKLLLSCLLLASLCALSSWSSVVVIQSPDISVMEGETVNITCCSSVEAERMKFNWLKNHTEVKNENIIVKNQSQESLTNKYCSTLTLSNIRREDSGRYICKLSMEIPFYESGEGNGTVITVKSRENTGDDTDDNRDQKQDLHSIPVPLIIGVGVVVPLFLITVACFCSLRKRQAQAAARVIYEVPHIDSEEADMDKHSTSSSRGSSQWCQVPVYESCDYFERVQTKESE